MKIRFYSFLRISSGKNMYLYIGIDAWNQLPERDTHSFLPYLT
ncbi:hypothetical protein Q0590_01345 [Rhodocytophaga aerolata]|uniref:Transposase n=1 Tax=Rhodocytophaga aerolata TaxID=455078 RepID=A0ABT8QYF0_9BACT|nr:hypothetical protein [Rhodocytophaga aerolata]MDO1444871.1 hypothetical protein [Rhodocytophaga aerolata]